jgi:hypothetical protein
MYRMPRWLREAERGSLGFFALSTELEQQFSNRALAARTSPAERDALFTDFGAIVARAVLRYRRWDIDPWELDDIAQESYLAFVDIHTRWLAQVWAAPDGTLHPCFGRYVLRMLPLRLADRADALFGRSHAHLLDDGPLPERDDVPDPLLMEDDARAQELISAICRRLSPREALTFRRIVTAGFSVRTVARQTGESTRTLYGRWARITRTARDVVRERDAAA